MSNEGRPLDGKPIKPGDVFLTASGRNTTPYPKQKSERYSSEWLIDNAVSESTARGDRFNTRTFKQVRPLKSGGELIPGDRDSMLEYLFGDQPAVLPRPFLRPL